jgi:hypothetical protein
MAATTDCRSISVLPGEGPRSLQADRAIRRAAAEDLSAILVREGLAWTFVRYSSDYISQ